jgi:hypothetical protein
MAASYVVLLASNGLATYPRAEAHKQVAAAATRSEVEMTSTAAESQEAAVGQGADEEVSTSGSGAIAFGELVRVHYEWERASRRGNCDPSLDAEFRAKLEEFQEREGVLQHAYWSRRRPSAVALTIKARPRFTRWKLQGWRPVRGRFRKQVDPLTDSDAIVRLHRATDWLAREARIADLLHHCDALAIRVGEVLRGTSERIAMQRIFAVQSHLLGFIERTNGKVTDEEIAEFAHAQGPELIEIENYYARAADRSGRVVYFQGMVVGALLSAALAGALAVALLLTGWYEEPWLNDIEAFFVSYAAGGLGAIVSVMARMTASDKFELDYEVGRPTLRRLGALRPFVGAVFGVAVYFLISSGLPQVELPNSEEAFFYYGTVAFLAGFFERRTQVIFGSAEKTLERSLGFDEKGDDKQSGLVREAAKGGGPLAPGEVRRTVITQERRENGQG